MAFRIVLGFVGALAIGSIAAQPGWADDDQPDPALCPDGGDGYFYVAMGVDVFRWQPETFAIIERVPNDAPSDQFLTPPDPTQPVGCHDNPVRALSGSPVVGTRDLISVPGTSSNGRFYVMLKLVPPGYSGQALREENFAAFCEGTAGTGVHKIEQIDPPGLIKCSIQTLNDPNQWRSSYEARPEAYTTPLGEAFIVPCPSVGLDDCFTGYKINKTLQLGYTFKLVDVPIEHVIDLDRALQSMIEDHRVKNYVWPQN
jgi:hypothetical protein